MSALLPELNTIVRFLWTLFVYSKFPNFLLLQCHFLSFCIRIFRKFEWNAQSMNHNMWLLNGINRILSLVFVCYEYLLAWWILIWLSFSSFAPNVPALLFEWHLICAKRTRKQSLQLIISCGAAVVRETGAILKLRLVLYAIIYTDFFFLVLIYSHTKNWFNYVFNNEVEIEWISNSTINPTQYVRCFISQCELFILMCFYVIKSQHVLVVNVFKVSMHLSPHSSKTTNFNKQNERCTM